jgi:hypothetical protein
MADLALFVLTHTPAWAATPHGLALAAGVAAVVTVTAW